MVDDRKNIKIPRELFERLDSARPNRDTWEQYLEKLLAEAPVRAEQVELTNEQIREIARQTIDEMEARQNDQW